MPLSEALMAKLVHAIDLGSIEVTLAGSSPVQGTIETIAFGSEEECGGFFVEKEMY